MKKARGFYSLFFWAGFLLVLLGGTQYLEQGRSADVQGFAAGDVLQGSVVRVTDGDSLTLRDSEGQNYTIRLYGIDAPEWDQPHGSEAGEALSELVSGSDVRIEVEDIDVYERLVGTVYLDGENINQQLVRGGHAWWYQFFARDVSELEAAEISARAEGLGLWAYEDPVPPWDWRRQRR